MLCFFGSLSRRINFDDLFFLASWGLKSSALSNVNDQFRIVHLVWNFTIKCILHSCGLWWPFENNKTKQNNSTTSSQHWIFVCFFFHVFWWYFFAKVKRMNKNDKDLSSSIATNGFLNSTFSLYIGISAQKNYFKYKWSIVELQRLIENMTIHSLCR